jgi:hypothetical protein
MRVAHGVRKRYRVEAKVHALIFLREFVVVLCKPRIRFSEVFFAGHQSTFTSL